MLTVQETAKILGVSVHTVYRLINSGDLLALKISQRRTVIKAEEIEGELSAIKVSSRKTLIKAEELERYINRK